MVFAAGLGDILEKGLGAPGTHPPTRAHKHAHAHTRVQALHAQPSTQKGSGRVCG